MDIDLSLRECALRLLLSRSCRFVCDIRLLSVLSKLPAGLGGLAELFVGGGIGACSVDGSDLDSICGSVRTQVKSSSQHVDSSIK